MISPSLERERGAAVFCDWRERQSNNDGGFLSVFLLLVDRNHLAEIKTDNHGVLFRSLSLVYLYLRENEFLSEMELEGAIF